MKNLEDILKKISQLQIDPKITENMASQIMEIESGGGFIKIKINQLLEIIDIKIDESIFTRNDKVLLERLIVEAVNSAIYKVKTLQMKNIQNLLGSMPDVDKK